MNYEKGAARNLVQFSEYPDIAFTDTGITVDDGSKPNKNVIWSSDRVTEYVNNIVRNQQQYYQPQPYRPVQQSTPPIVNNTFVQPERDQMTITSPSPRWYKGEHHGNYTNGYRKYHSGRMRMPRGFRPSWWMSWIIPSRQHYCDKCCNYLDHKWSSVWKDNPELANNKCSCNSKCNMQASPKPKSRHTHTVVHERG